MLCVEFFPVLLNFGSSFGSSCFSGSLPLITLRLIYHVVLRHIENGCLICLVTALLHFVNSIPSFRSSFRLGTLGRDDVAADSLFVPTEYLPAE